MLNLAVRDNLELKASWEWIKSAFYIFREYPVQFILLSIVSILTGLLPLFGAFMAPLFTARFAYIANKVENGEKIEMASLFKDFFANITLIRLSFFNFAINAILLIGQYLIGLYFEDKNQAVNFGKDFVVLLFLLPLLILQIAMWISPIICLNDPKTRPGTAMWMSIKTGLYNVSTFLLYSLLIIVFTLLALLPLGLGLFIWVPVLNIASYYVYKSAIIS
ncbi:MAG: hypothetical protein K0R14_100 [Burkholderiales bacterium]|jgi:hypothetical protein|nr:hypothetical protein [Burkholderiales bacterium]